MPCKLDCPQMIWRLQSDPHVQSLYWCMHKDGCLQSLDWATGKVHKDVLAKGRCTLKIQALH